MGFKEIIFIVLVIKVLIKILIRIEMDFMKLCVNMLINKIIVMVRKLMLSVCKLLKFLVLVLLLLRFWKVIGISVNLIIVISDFVMIGGKRFLIFENKLVIRKIKILVLMIELYMVFSLYVLLIWINGLMVWMV